MSREEQIRQILYRAVDELAAVLAQEEPKATGPPTMVNRKQLAEYTGLSPTYCTELLKRMEAQGQPGVLRNGHTVRVNLGLFERWYRNGKKLG